MKAIGFFEARTLAEAQTEPGGIGTLGEKLLHRTLKYYYEPDGTKHEAEVSGFFADVLNEDGITEIQTGSFSHIDRKLEVFLEEYPVTLVCPVVRERRIAYIDPETGEATKPRLSPKRGRIEDVFTELIYIRKRLSHPGLVIVVPLVDAVEYRVRREPKRRFRDKGFDKAELVPTALAGEEVFVSREDWLRLLPEGLTGFKARELAEAKALPARTARAMCAALVHAGALTRERAGKSYVYYREYVGTD